MNWFKKDKKQAEPRTTEEERREMEEKERIEEEERRKKEYLLEADRKAKLEKQWKERLERAVEEAAQIGRKEIDLFSLKKGDIITLHNHDQNMRYSVSNVTEEYIEINVGAFVSLFHAGKSGGSIGSIFIRFDKKRNAVLGGSFYDKEVFLWKEEVSELLKKVKKEIEQERRKEAARVIEKTGLNVEDVVRQILEEIKDLPEENVEEKIKKREKFKQEIFERIIKKMPICPKRGTFSTNFQELWGKNVKYCILSVEGAQKYEEAINDLVRDVEVGLFISMTK